MPTWDDSQRTVLSVGSNMGDRMDNLQGAVDSLFDARGLRLVGLSPVYETAPVGGPDQDDYLNLIVLADTLLEPVTLLERVKSVEEAFHRVRKVRWGPRTMDIDVVAYGERTSDDPSLMLPHPRAHERAFVLQPWFDIDPDAALPVRGPIRDLLAKVHDQDLRRRDDLPIQTPD